MIQLNGLPTVVTPWPLLGAELEYWSDFGVIGSLVKERMRKSGI